MAEAVFTDTDVPKTPLAEADVPSLDAAVDLVLFDPTRVTLFRTGGATVRATITDQQIGAERSFLRVQIARAFPLSDPERYIGLRDEKDKDIGMFATLTGLDAESRRILDEELNRRYFLPRVVNVVSVKEEYGTITWQVDTDKGRRTHFVQNLRDSTQELTPGRFLITDKDGNRFEIPDVEKLDSKSYSILSRVM